MHYAVDRQGALSNARRTSTGGYLVDATLARTGVLQYPGGEGGGQKHFNSPEVLTACLDGIETAPVTNRHPERFVTADTYQQVAAGHVVGKPTFDGTFVHATLAIQDAKLIRDIELGVAREVSMGYMFDGEAKDGVTQDGEAFDLVRTEIKWNHIAIVPAGRAGSAVSLVLDSNEIPTEEVKVFKINGADVAEDKVQAAIDALEGQLAAMQADKDALKTAKDEAEAKLAHAVSDEAIDLAVKARLEREAVAKAHADKVERVQKGYPKIVLDGKSADFIDALDLALAEKLAADPEGLNQIRDSSPGGEAPAAKPVVVIDARDEMMKAKRELAFKK